MANYYFGYEFSSNSAGNYVILHAEINGTPLLDVGIQECGDVPDACIWQSMSIIIRNNSYSRYSFDDDVHIEIRNGTVRFYIDNGATMFNAYIPAYVCLRVFEEIAGRNN